MFRNPRILLVLAVIIILSFYSGYKSKDIPHIFSKSNNVLAKVNNYEITLEDFMDQKQKYAPLIESGHPINKKYIVDILIDNIILLMEAERMKLNQNGSFLKEIESFWRQSLISELIRTETREIREKIKISEEEIRDFHHYLKKELLTRLACQ